MSSYYENFAKYVLHSSDEKRPNVVPTYSYAKWLKTPVAINDLSISELKPLLKQSNCRISGKRAELIKRLKTAYVTRLSATTIQRIFRGFLQRSSDKLRGPAWKDRSKCVNDTEFQTMDDIQQIPPEHFFSYTCGTGFVYGFNLLSLIQYINMRRPRQFTNPYNREDIPPSVVRNVCDLYLKNSALRPYPSEDISRILIVLEENEKNDADFAGITIPATFDLTESP
jgi:hypothetical protein